MTASFRDNIRAKMTEMGLNMKQLSLKAGLGETGAREIILGIRRSPTVESLQKLATALGCDIRDFFAEPHEATRRTVTPLSIIGAVEAGAWQKDPHWPKSEWFYEPVPNDPRFAAFERFGLLMKGPAMDQVYSDGDVVVCISMKDLQEKPESGRRYIVHRKNSADKIEVSVKEYYEDPDGSAWLMPKSSKPEYQAPVKLEAGSTADVTIYARVTGFWRRET